MPNTFSRWHSPEPPVEAQEDDGRLCGFADPVHFASPRQNGTVAFMDRSVLNDNSASLQEADVDDDAGEI
jgi:hypothetical protein